MVTIKLIDNSSKDINRANDDMISDLPSAVVDRILQFLPLKDAVRTSILSTHWRYKWTCVPQLVLDKCFFSAFLQFSCPCEVEYDQHDEDAYDSWCRQKISPAMSARLELVNNVLVCHDGPIVKLMVRIPHWFREDADISHWISFVSGKFVREFTLSQEQDLATGLYRSRKLPDIMFSCTGFKTLTHLTLVDFSLSSLPTAFSGFQCLISLQVHIVDVLHRTNEASNLEILVSKCPQLESLDFKIYEKESSLTIHAPKLQDLVLNGRLSSICLDKTKKITSLYFGTELEQRKDIMIEFLGSLPHVEKVVLVHNFWEGNWLKEVVPAKKLQPPTELRQLKHLILHGIQLHSQFVISFILCLFQMAPNLHKLEIYVYGSSLGDMAVEGDFSLNYLKCAKVICQSHMPSYSIALRLIKLILASSPVLEVMTFRARMEAEEKLNITKELLRYHRASANAEIIFKT